MTAQSTWKKSTASMVVAWVRRNCRQLVDGTAATALYCLIWPEVALADYTSLPEHTREQISVRIGQLRFCQPG